MTDIRDHAKKFIQKRINTTFSLTNYHRKPQISHTYSLGHTPKQNQASKTQANQLQTKSTFAITHKNYFKNGYED